MKNLIRLFLILFVAGIAIGTHTSCSEDSDCSIAALQDAGSVRNDFTK